MAILLDEKSRVVVQGITGSEGGKHTRRMVASGTSIVGLAFEPWTRLVSWLHETPQLVETR